MDSSDLQQVVAQLREENAGLRKQLAEPDLKAFEQVRELRATNKKLTDEFKRVTSECVQLSFKSRHTDAELKKTGAELKKTQEELQALLSELDQTRSQEVLLGQSLEDLRTQLSQSKETVLSHENELDRQKEELTRRQAQMETLRQELEQREGRISNLETLIKEFKEQYLSGEYMSVEEPLEAPGQHGDESPAYKILIEHMESWLGFAGATIVDQVYELSGVSTDTTDSSAIESVFESLQDAASDFVQGTEQQDQLESVLAKCWERLQGVRGAQASPAVDGPASVEPVVPVEELAPTPDAVVPAVELEPTPEAVVAVEELEPTPEAVVPVEILEPTPEAVVPVEELEPTPDAVVPVEELEPTPEAVVAVEILEPTADAVVPVEEIVSPSEEHKPDLELTETEGPANAVHVEEPLPVTESEAGGEPGELSRQERSAQRAADALSQFLADADLTVGEGAGPAAADLTVGEETPESLPVAESSDESGPSEDHQALLELLDAASAGEHVTAEEEPAVGESPTIEFPPVAAAPDTPCQRKARLISEGLSLTEGDPSKALDMLEDALGMEAWSGQEAEVELGLARLKRGRADITEHLIEALPALEICEFFDLLPHIAQGDGEVGPLCEFLKLIADQPRSVVVPLEAKFGLAGRSATRELIGAIGCEDEERTVELLLDHIYAGSGLKLPLPSPAFEARRDLAGPAAFVGTLRQALRLVDYTLFDFQQLDVVSYDGPERFIVDGALEPNLTLMFHRDVEGMPAEEVRFLAFRRLVQLYRRYITLSHLACSFDAPSRLALVQSALNLLEAEGIDGVDKFRATLGSDGSIPTLLSFLREAHTDTQVEVLADLGNWLAGNQLVESRFNLYADRFAFRVCGLGNATYGSLREELAAHPEAFAEFEAKGLRGLFANPDPVFGPARLRVQRVWTAAFHEKLGYE